MRVLSFAAVTCVLACSSSEDTTPAGSFTFFEATVGYQRLGKIDVVFAIDDSPSMADKAVADQVGAMVARLRVGETSAIFLVPTNPTHR